MAEARRKCTKCGLNRLETSYVSARGRTCAVCRRKRVRHSARDVHLMETYGITLEEYDEMLEAQGGVCAITGTKPRGRQHLDVDHDHQLERELLALGWDSQAAARSSVRGLLSRAANRRLLPAVKDDVNKLYAAIDYLESPPAKVVLA